LIVTKTPLRISFFGGGTDFPSFYNEYGGSVLSTTFDKYCYITVRHLPPFFEYKNEFVYSKIERVSSIDEIVHPAIRNAMSWLKMRDIRLSYDADLPARSGLGTSSAFAVGLLSAFYALKGKYADKTKLAEDAIYLERTLCKESGGIQDQIAVAFGGLNTISFASSGFRVSPEIISGDRKRELHEHLMLFFTGFSRNSYEIQKEMERKIGDNKSELLETLALVSEAEKILLSKTPITEFGRLLDYAWRLKRQFSDYVSTATIDTIYDKALAAGAIGGKLLGAGGGGFMLLFAEPDKQFSVRRAFEKLIEVPFQFENDGTSVLYYAPEPYEL